jgi:hypothetical protein
MTDYKTIHSCSFYCQRPICAMAQRDELWQLLEKIYTAVNEAEPDNRWTFYQAIAYAVDKLKEKK